MYPPERLDDIQRIADARYDRRRNDMHTHLLTLEIHANALDIERRNQLLLNEQLRLAREERRNGLRTGLRIFRNILGGVLITAGERVAGASARRMEPTPSGTA